MGAEPSAVMSHVDVYALRVLDEESYREYRAAMTPLLHEMGGDFGFDIKVAEVLRSSMGVAFNRVFSIGFPSVETRDAFFTDPRYLRVRAMYFEHSVAERLHLGQLIPPNPLP